MNIVVDTNVLLRILLEDQQQPQQVQAARQLAKNAGQLYVPQVVQVESAWMMERGYQLDKSVILKLLTHLQSNEHFVLQEAEIFHDALQQYSLANVGFADCIVIFIYFCTIYPVLVGWIKRSVSTKIYNKWWIRFA